MKQTEDKVRQRTGPEKVKAQNLGTRCIKPEQQKSPIQQTGLHVEHKDKDHEDYYEIKFEYINVSSRMSHRL